MKEKILITGATGRVGGELVRLFIRDNITVRITARNPSAVTPDFAKMTEIVEFNYEKPETFSRALSGIKKVFLVARPGDNNSDKAAEPFIDAAKRAGIEHIVNLTAMGVEKDDSFMLRVLEKNIEASGIAYTHLRPNWFMQNFNSEPMLGQILSIGVLRLPAGDAMISYIDLRDIAAAAYAILTSGSHEGKAYTLTGSESLTYYQVTEKITKASGRKISYIPVTEEAAAGELLKNKVPQGLIDRWINFYRRVREGICAGATEDTALITGRPQILFDQYAMDYASKWK